MSSAFLVLLMSLRQTFRPRCWAMMRSPHWTSNAYLACTRATFSMAPSAYTSSATLGLRQAFLTTARRCLVCTCVALVLIPAAASWVLLAGTVRAPCCRTRVSAAFQRTELAIFGPCRGGSGIDLPHCPLYMVKPVIHRCSWIWEGRILNLFGPKRMVSECVRCPPSRTPGRMNCFSVDTQISGWLADCFKFVI